jgi:hypothetical protein
MNIGQIVNQASNEPNSIPASHAVQAPTTSAPHGSKTMSWGPVPTFLELNQLHPAGFWVTYGIYLDNTSQPNDHLHGIETGSKKRPRPASWSSKQDSLKQKKGAEWVEEKETREWLKVKESEKTEVKVGCQLAPLQRQSRRKRSFIHDEDSLARLQGERRTLDNTTQYLPVRCSSTSKRNGSQEYGVTEIGKIDKKGQSSRRIKREPTNIMIANLPRVEDPNVVTRIVYVKDVVPTIMEQRERIFMG